MLNEVDEYPQPTKNFREISQNLLTNCHFCGIIIMSRGEHKTERQETVDRQKRNFQGQCALTRLGGFRNKSVEHE